MTASRSPRAPAIAGRACMRRTLLSLWLGASALWVSYWTYYFHANCRAGWNFACAVGEFFGPLYYSLPQVLILILAPPLALLFLGYWLWRAILPGREGEEE